MISARSTQNQIGLFSLAETDLWLANAIDELQCGADPAQVAATLQDIRQQLASLVYPPVQEAQRNHLRAHRVLSFGRRVDRGIKRKDRPNEDTTWASQGTMPGTAVPFGLFLVADGIGGHSHGQLASRLAKKTLVSSVLSPILSGARLPNSELLVEGVHCANRALLAANAQTPDGQEDMGTTVTAALVVEGAVAYIVNVGDSRAYLYRPEDGLEQLTADHSRVAQLLAMKAISPQEALTHPLRNQIYRCLGGDAALVVDAFTVDLRLGDTLLLCSDGVWGPVGDRGIEAILRARHPAPLKALGLIEAANIAGGPDNCSAVVIEIDQRH